MHSYLPLNNTYLKAKGLGTMNHVIINGYFISLPPIGTGLYGTTYKAYDMKNPRDVAIKTTSNLSRAQREVEVMKGYEICKYLPALYDYFTYGETAYTVMEYIKGKRFGLDFSTRSETKYEETYSLTVVLNILEALQKLHDSGWVHMDTKPGNIIAWENNPEQITLIDFNTSREIRKNLIQIDIRNAAKMFFFLTTGFVPRCPENASFKNKKIRSAILKAFSKDKYGYSSAKDFYDSLVLCR